MIRFHSPDRVSRADCPAEWIYLGKRASTRERLTRALAKPPMPIGSAIHREADRLRPLFLEWIAELGSEAPCPASWWAGTLAWKAWSASDLFLLLSYQSYCLGLDRSRDLTVVVEDPWLLAQLSDALSSNAGARVVASGRLRAVQLGALALGAARRLKWFGRMLFHRAVLRAAWYGLPLPEKPRDGSVLIYTHLTERSLSGETGWSDPYLPGLAEELDAAGVRAYRAVYPDATGRAKELSQRRSNTIPLLLYASCGDLLRCLFAPVPKVSARVLDGMRTDRLLERERYEDFSRAGRCAYLLMKRCAGAALALARWKAVVFPWEGQPQERMLVLAARERKIKTVGSQHTTVPRMQLPFYCGSTESERNAIPDLLMVTGPHPEKMLREGGVPAGRLRPGGSRRYETLAAGSVPRIAPSGRDILAVLPVDLFQARHLLLALERAFAGADPGFKIRVKDHPAEPAPIPGGSPFQRADGNLAEELRRCAGVVFTGSTAGLESLAAGLPTLRYRSETLLDLDPCETIGEGVLPSASDSDLKERLLSLAGRTPSLPEGALRDLFTPLDREAWKEALGA